jgi:hypothetical protein
LPLAASHQAVTACAKRAKNQVLKSALPLQQSRLFLLLRETATCTHNPMQTTQDCDYTHTQTSELPASVLKTPNISAEQMNNFYAQEKPNIFDAALRPGTVLKICVRRNSIVADIRRDQKLHASDAYAMPALPIDCAP